MTLPNGSGTRPPLGSKLKILVLTVRHCPSQARQQSKHQFPMRKAREVLVGRYTRFCVPSSDRKFQDRSAQQKVVSKSRWRKMSVEILVACPQKLAKSNLLRIIQTSKDGWKSFQLLRQDGFDFSCNSRKSRINFRGRADREKFSDSLSGIVVNRMCWLGFSLNWRRHRLSLLKKRWCR
jgi:hypothetical protein